MKVCVCACVCVHLHVCISQKRSEVMVVMTDVTGVLGAVLSSFPADVRKHLKAFCPLISGLLGTIQGHKGTNKKTLASMETS